VLRAVHVCAYLVLTSTVGGNDKFCNFSYILNTVPKYITCVQGNNLLGICADENVINNTNASISRETGKNKDVKEAHLKAERERDKARRAAAKEKALRLEQQMLRRTSLYATKLVTSS